MLNCIHTNKRKTTKKIKVKFIIFYVIWLFIVNCQTQ